MQSLETIYAAGDMCLQTPPEDAVAPVRRAENERLECVFSGSYSTDPRKTNVDSKGSAMVHDQLVDSASNDGSSAATMSQKAPLVPPP